MYKILGKIKILEGWVPNSCPSYHLLKVGGAILLIYHTFCLAVWEHVRNMHLYGGPRNTTQKYKVHCWWRTCLGPFLAKTSRTAVLTAIMDLSAGGRLYKCLYKMHVASRAFWGAFWGAFRVFLRDVGWGETRWPPGPLESPATAQQTALRWTF